MRVFRDEKGRGWNIEINVSAIRRVKDLTGVNLLDAVAGELLTQLQTDVMLLCDVLYAACKPQADAEGVTDEQFGEGLAGDAIEHATNALLEEFANFFPSRQGQMISVALAKMKQAEERIYAAARTRADEELGERLDSAVTKFIESFGRPQAKSE